MPMTTRGEILVEKAPIYGWNRSIGLYTLRTWHGIPEAIHGQFNELVNSGECQDVETSDGGDGSLYVRARYARDGSIPANGGANEVPVNEWTIRGHYEHRSAKEHPRYLALHVAVIAAIQSAATKITSMTTIADYQATYSAQIAAIKAGVSDTSQHPLITELLNTLITEATHYQHPMFTFRRTTTISENYPNYIKSGSVKSVYVADKNEGARSTKLEAENDGKIPASIVSAMAKIQRPQAATGYTIGWLKDSFDVTTNALGKYQIVQDYTFGNWRSIFYPNAA